MSNEVIRGCRNEDWLQRKKIANMRANGAGGGGRSKWLAVDNAVYGRRCGRAEGLVDSWDI